MHAASPSLPLGAAGAAARAPYFHAYALRALPGSLCLRSALPLVAEDAPTKWVHMAYEGAWKGHADGEFQLTREHFAQVVANFESQINPLPLDFDHEREFMAPPWPARGWVHGLKVEDGADGRAHLWGLVEFGPEAVRFNKQGGYRFCSIVIDFESSDRVTGRATGARLRSLALTDDPFLDGQQPIVLSQRAARASTNSKHKELSMKVSKDQFKAALDGLEGEDVTPEMIEAAMQYAAAQEGKSEAPEEPGPEAPPMADKPDDEEAAMADEPTGEPPIAADAPAGEQEVPLAEDMPAEPSADGDAALAALAPLAEETGMDLASLAAALTEKRAEIASLLSGGESEGAGAAMSDKAAELALSARDATIASLSSRVDELAKYKAEREQSDAKAWALSLRDDGRILDDDVDEWASLRLSDAAKAEKLAPKARVVPLGRHASKHEPPTEGEDAARIDEADPDVVRLRADMTQMGGKWKRREVQDRAIRRHLAANTKTPAQARA